MLFLVLVTMLWLLNTKKTMLFLVFSVPIRRLGNFSKTPLPPEPSDLWIAPPRTATSSFPSQRKRSAASRESNPESLGVKQRSMRKGKVGSCEAGALYQGFQRVPCCCLEVFR